MTLDLIEKVIQYSCGVIAVGSMMFAVGRLLRVLHRVRGRVSGNPPRVMQSSWFYIIRVNHLWRCHLFVMETVTI